MKRFLPLVVLVGSLSACTIYFGDGDDHDDDDHHPHYPDGGTLDGGVPTTDASGIDGNDWFFDGPAPMPLDAVTPPCDPIDATTSDPSEPGCPAYP